jgi:hypothetical protein
MIPFRDRIDGIRLWHLLVVGNGISLVGNTYTICKTVSKGGVVERMYCSRNRHFKLYYYT